MNHLKAAILFSLTLHLFCGWMLLQNMQDVTSLQFKQTHEPIWVTTITPLTVPHLPSPAKYTPAQKKMHSRRPMQIVESVPVFPPKTTLVNEHANPQEEANNKKAITAFSSLPYPLISSGENEKMVFRTIGSPVNAKGQSSLPSGNTEAASVPMEGSGNGLSVTGPSISAGYLSNPTPQYPAIARRQKLQGTTILRVLVNPEGRPESVTLNKSSGIRILDETALDAVKQWLFVPARCGAKAVSAWVDIPIRFRLN